MPGWSRMCPDDQEHIYLILKICFSSYMHILQNIDDCDDGDNCVDEDYWDYWVVDDVDDGDDCVRGGSSGSQRRRQQWL